MSTSSISLRLQVEEYALTLESLDSAYQCYSHASMVYDSRPIHQESVITKQRLYFHFFISSLIIHVLVDT